MPPPHWSQTSLVSSRSHSLESSVAGWIPSCGAVLGPRLPQTHGLDPCSLWSMPETRQEVCVWLWRGCHCTGDLWRVWAQPGACTPWHPDSNSEAPCPSKVSLPGTAHWHGHSSAHGTQLSKLGRGQRPVLVSDGAPGGPVSAGSRRSLERLRVAPWPVQPRLAAWLPAFLHKGNLLG